VKPIHASIVLFVFGVYTAFYGFIDANWYGIYMLAVGVVWLGSGFLFLSTQLYLI
jgi:hypothetical protein